MLLRTTKRNRSLDITDGLSLPTPLLSMELGKYKVKIAPYSSRNSNHIVFGKLCVHNHSCEHLLKRYFLTI